MISRSGRLPRNLFCGLVLVSLVAAAPGAASAAGIVSQASAQAVNLNLASGALTLQISNPPTSASNDGTQSNAEVDVSPLVTLLSGQTFLQAGALKEAAEANQNGTSYGCAGVASPGGGIQVGDAGQSCSATGSGTDGVGLNLGSIPGLGTLATLVGGISITADAVIAHGYLDGTGPAILDASVANVHVQVGNGTPIPVTISSAPNQDLLSAVLAAIVPGLGLLGTTVSALLSSVVSLTTNYQPAPEPDGNGTWSVSGLHVGLVGNALATADIARVTVGPNVPAAPVAAFSFANLPLILGGLAIAVIAGYLARLGVRRVRYPARSSA